MFHLGTHGYFLSIRTILVYIAFLNQPQIGRDAHGLSDVFRVQLLEDVLLVILHGVGVDEERSERMSSSRFFQRRAAKE